MAGKARAALRKEAGVIDAFVGSSIVLHVNKNAKLDDANLKKVLDKVGVKYKSMKEDATKNFPKPKADKKVAKG
ncbi:MAG: hypothetical protein ACI835_000329 [Planctomycetota bacterium]|jgi:hypothetical protein